MSRPSKRHLPSRSINVLIACESSGTVREAFRKLGFSAWSCDLLPADDGSPFHYTGDMFDPTIINKPWDLIIAHPPCTYLCVSGLHWNKRTEGRAAKTEAALQFVQRIMDLGVQHLAIENPVSCISTRIRKPDQIIHPWQFGHAESKTTCLWLRGLPKLVPTDIVSKPPRGYWDNQTPSGQNRLAPSPTRWKERSRTYEGIANAMATQWGSFLQENAR